MDEPTPNPAVERQLALPPTLLAALDTDPDAMMPHYRKMTAIQATNLHMLAKSPAVPIGQKVQILELFAKLSGADRKGQQNPLEALPRFSVTINIPNLPQPEKKVVEVVEDVAEKISVKLPQVSDNTL